MLQPQPSRLVHLVQERFAAAVGQQERVVDQVVQRDHGLPGQRMAAVEYGHHLVLGQ